LPADARTEELLGGNKANSRMALKTCKTCVEKDPGLLIMSEVVREQANGMSAAFACCDEIG
jgi:hypothetical protein